MASRGKGYGGRGGGSGFGRGGRGSSTKGGRGGKGQPRWDHPFGVALEMLRVGDQRVGCVTNVVRDKVFLDVGAVRDGLLHLSEKEVEKRRIRIGARLFLSVGAVDAKAGTIRLELPTAASCSDAGPRGRDGGRPSFPRKRPIAQIAVGDRFTGIVSQVDRRRSEGYVSFGAARDGFCISDIGRNLTLGQRLRGLKVVRVDASTEDVELVEDPEIADVLAELESEWGPCEALYMHGSSVFGNRKPADVDLLAVVGEPTRKPIRDASRDTQFTLGKYEVSVYGRQNWLDKLALHDLTMLTCVFLPRQFVLHENKSFGEATRAVKLDPLQVYESFVSYAEYTWVLAEVRINRNMVEKCLKGVYYCFRVLDLAWQLIEHGRIADWQAANGWYDRVNRMFGEVPIRRLQFSLVEALFARDYLAAEARVREKLLEKTGRSSEALALLGDKVDLKVPPLHCNAGDTCAICLEALQAAPPDVAMGSPEDEKPTDRKSPARGSCKGEVVALARCGHAFHVGCIAELVQAEGRKLQGPGQRVKLQCPVCRESVGLGLDTDTTITRDCARRGVRLPARGGRVYAGYPATLVLPTGGDQAPDDSPSARIVVLRALPDDIAESSPRDMS